MSKFKAGADRDRPDRRVLLRWPTRSSPTRSRTSTRFTRPSPTPTGSSPARWCASRASTSARSPRVSQEPGCKSASTTQSACQAADVTMNITNQGLPIHDDATFAIRPRIFLEGNFFVDVSPGHAAGAGGQRRPHLPDPAGRRARPVRSGPHRTAGQHAPEPPDAAPAVRQGGQAGRPVVQQVRSSTGCPPTSTRRSSPTTRSASSPTTSPTTSPPRARSPGPLDTHPAEPREPDHGLQHHRQRVRAREHGAASRPWPSCPGRCRRRSRRSTRSTPPSRRCGRSPGRWSRA